MTTAATWRPDQAQSRTSAAARRRTRRPMVAGHVDGIAELVARDDLTDMARLEFRAPAELAASSRPRVGRARRRFAHGQRGRRRHVFGADHPAHLEGDDFRRACSRARAQSRSRQMARYAARLLETRSRAEARLCAPPRLLRPRSNWSEAMAGPRQGKRDKAAAKARASSSSRRASTSYRRRAARRRHEGAERGGRRGRPHQRAGLARNSDRDRYRRSMPRSARRPMTAWSRSAASSTARPFISRSCRTNRRAA